MRQFLSQGKCLRFSNIGSSSFNRLRPRAAQSKRQDALPAPVIATLTYSDPDTHIRSFHTGCTHREMFWLRTIARTADAKPIKKGSPPRRFGFQSSLRSSLVAMSTGSIAPRRWVLADQRDCRICVKCAA